MEIVQREVIQAENDPTSGKLMLVVNARTVNTKICDLERKSTVWNSLETSRRLRSFTHRLRAKDATFRLNFPISDTAGLVLAVQAPT